MAMKNLERMKKKEAERKRKNGSTMVQDMVARMVRRIELSLESGDTSKLSVVNDYFKKWNKEVDDGHKKEIEEVNEELKVVMTRLNNYFDIGLENISLKDRSVWDVNVLTETRTNIFNEAKNKLQHQFEIKLSVMSNRHDEENKKAEAELKSFPDNLVFNICRSLRQVTRDRLMDVCPECPVCLETITLDEPIFQCEAGHLLCAPCLNSLVTEICPTCRGKIKGRALVFEKILRGLSLAKNGGEYVNTWGFPFCHFDRISPSPPPAATSDIF